MTSLAHALKSLYPTSEFAIEDNDIGKIRWFKNQPEGFNFSNNDVGNTAKQTKLEELNTEVERLNQIEISKQYQRDRKPEYPPIGDQLDALWKGGDAAAEMLAKVQAVKAKYPKPE